MRVVVVVTGCGVWRVRGGGDGEGRGVVWAEWAGVCGECVASGAGGVY